MCVKAQCEGDIIRHTTMADDDVVFISDDEERDDDPSNRRRMGEHSNTYEIGPVLAHTLGGGVVVLEQPNETAKDEVIYVPDDNDEESFIIGPIRNTSMKIIFGCALKAPTQFPYGLLQEIKSHMENNVKGVSNATVKCVWECVLEQLSVMRIAYSPHIDVCSISKLILIAFYQMGAS